jgi:hypothetical protein
MAKRANNNSVIDLGFLQMIRKLRLIKAPVCQNLWQIPAHFREATPRQPVLGRVADESNEGNP